MNNNNKCRKCRKEGVKLLLKGDRCLSPKCALINKNYKPGQHGPNGFSKLSEYGKQLREKQKIKRLYGVSESQLKNYYTFASNKKGDTGENLLLKLETRMDNIVYLVGLGKSRKMARQLVGHKFFRLNDKNVNIPSINLSIGDKITIKKNADKLLQEKNEAKNWLSFDKKDKSINVKNLPSMEEIDIPCDINLIIEFYSR